MFAFFSHSPRLLNVWEDQEPILHTPRRRSDKELRISSSQNVLEASHSCWTASYERRGGKKLKWGTGKWKKSERRIPSWNLGQGTVSLLNVWVLFCLIQLQKFGIWELPVDGWIRPRPSWAECGREEGRQQRIFFHKGLQIRHASLAYIRPFLSLILRTVFTQYIVYVLQKYVC